MIDHSTEVCIVELERGQYWCSTGLRDLPVSDPSEAQRVDPKHSLERIREDYPRARVVRVQVTTKEVVPTLDAFAHAKLDWTTAVLVRTDCTAEDEQRLAGRLLELQGALPLKDRVRARAAGASLRRHEFKVFLDDAKPVPEDWVSAKTAAGAIALLDNVKVTHLSLDHDLGEGHGTGYQVACWLEDAVINRGYPMPIVTIHSDNGPGRVNIALALGSIQRWLDSRSEGEQAAESVPHPLDDSSQVGALRGESPQGEIRDPGELGIEAVGDPEE